MTDARPSRRRPSSLRTGSEQFDVSESQDGQSPDAASQSHDRSASSKIPIPRAGAAITSDQSSSNRRVGHACESCREQKTKCSGDRPTCQRCQDLRLTCTYGDRKRERTAKQLRDLTKQVQDYELLLNTLRPRLNPADIQLVQDTLSRHRIDCDKLGTDDPPASSEETVLPGSLGGIDYTEEDFNRNEWSKAMGFVGKHSEISWIYSLKRENEYELSATGGVPAISPEDRQGHSVTSVSYFLDDTEIPLIEDIDPLGRPPQAVADGLMNAYFNTVHPSFPIIGKETFTGQYKSFYSSPFVRPGRRWLAILNLIYAIATRYFRQVHSEQTDTGDDELIYFSRAWRLSMGESAILGHPDLQQVQVEGLSSFYLLCMGHVNRSWRVCGRAIRSAVAMGLNLRNESNYVTHVSKEARYRVWWSLHTLETVLCNMTGRPLSTRKETCTTPLPVPFEEGEFADGKVAQIMADSKARGSFVEQFASRRLSEPGTTAIEPVHGKEIVNPNMSLYFLCLVDLDLIMREAIEKLYSPGDAPKFPREMEAAIVDLDTKADAWHSRLPAVFQFMTEPSSQAFERQRLSLALHFYSMKLLLCKPYLRHPDRQVEPGGGPEKFGDRIAALCVDAACRMLDSFPDEPDMNFIHQVSPWWCILHYLLQSTSVLLIELSFRAKLNLPESGEPLEKVSKASRWLQEMSNRSLAFHRAWAIWGEVISRLGMELGSQVDDTSEVHKYRRIEVVGANRAAYSGRTATLTTRGGRLSQSSPSDSISPRSLPRVPYRGRVGGSLGPNDRGRSSTAETEEMQDSESEMDAEADN